MNLVINTTLVVVGKVEMKRDEFGFVENYRNDGDGYVLEKLGITLE